MRGTTARAALGAALLILVASTGALGAAPAGADGGTPATPLPASKVTITKNIPFAEVDGITLTLDVYEPQDPAVGRPGLILVHGGGWGVGQAKDLADEGRLVARQGWVAYSVNYRLADELTSTWPAALSDVQRAARWVGANATTYGTDRDKLAVVGLSAGGHLATLLAEIGTEVDSTGKKLDDANPPVQIRAVAALSPPTRLAGLVPQGDGGDPVDCADNKKCAQFWHLPLVEHFIGCLPADCPETYTDASPASRVTATTVPIWFANSTDEIVALPQAKALDKALEDAGIEHHLELVPGSQHADAYESRVWNTMMPWLATQLGVAAPPPVSFSERSILLSPVVVISVVVGLAMLIALLAVALRDDEGEM